MEKEDASEEAARTKTGKTEIAPSTREDEEHHIDHAAFRSWCPHCVRAKGKDMDHRKADEKDRGLPEFSFDECFLGTSWATS